MQCIRHCTIGTQCCKITAHRNNTSSPSTREVTWPTIWSHMTNHLKSYDQPLEVTWPTIWSHMTNLPSCHMTNHPRNFTICQLRSCKINRSKVCKKMWMWPCSSSAVMSWRWCSGMASVCRGTHVLLCGFLHARHMPLPHHAIYSLHRNTFQVIRPFLAYNSTCTAHQSRVAWLQCRLRHWHRNASSIVYWASLDMSMSVSKTVDKINGITRCHNWLKTHMYVHT